MKNEIKFYICCFLLYVFVILTFFFNDWKKGRKLAAVPLTQNPECRDGFMGGMP